ncbi:MAG: hypothetical protein WC806_00270 [Candidatus Gracilibacteria bacterium]|jgi:hypothetical protein
MDEASEEGENENLVYSAEKAVYPEKLNGSSRIFLLIESVYLRIKNALNFIDSEKVKEAETRLDELIKMILNGEIYDIAGKIASINRGLYPEEPEIFSETTVVSRSRIFVLPWNLPIYIHNEKKHTVKNGLICNDEGIITTCWDYQEGKDSLNECSSKFVQHGKYVYVADISVNSEGRIIVKIKRGNLTHDGQIWA